MADISDVEQALTGHVTSILYPEGPSRSSIVGAVCRIYRGWPNAATLNPDLSSGVVNITIIADNDSGRTTTRYLPEWKTNMITPGTTACVSGLTINISGSPQVADVIGVLIDGSAFAYRIESGDTPGLIAANLSQLISGTFFARAVGTTIIVAAAYNILVRVACDRGTSYESRRQEKDLRIICWCPAPPVRDAVATAIDAALDLTSFLVLSDETTARIAYKNTASYDQAQNALLYRRDLVYTVEYPTVTLVQSPSMLFGASDLNGNILYG